MCALQYCEHVMKWWTISRMPSIKSLILTLLSELLIYIVNQLGEDDDKESAGELRENIDKLQTGFEIYRNVYNCYNNEIKLAKIAYISLLTNNNIILLFYSHPFKNDLILLKMCQKSFNPQINVTNLLLSSKVSNTGIIRGNILASCSTLFDIVSYSAQFLHSYLCSLQIL